jgi:type VI secretion system protein ImpK
MELLNCYLPVFKNLLSMTGKPDDFSDYTINRQVCIASLEKAIELTKALDIPEKQKHFAKTAVIAWMDETVLCSSLPWRQQWQGELLQRSYLNTTIAGELFFTLLHQLQPTESQARKVFLYCLIHDFHGQFSAAEDTQSLKNLIVRQRNLCLPKQWIEWPNDTPFSEMPTVPADAASKDYSLFTFFLLITLLYVLFTFILDFYAS